MRFGDFGSGASATIHAVIDVTHFTDPGWDDSFTLCGVDGDFIAEQGPPRLTVPFEPSVEPWPAR